jgi:pimeloyl-ACP methyl ester carboxylesterase
MISAPGPHWNLRPRHEWYTRHPWIFGPVFLAETPFRLRREVLAAVPEWPARLSYLWEQLKTLASAPASVSRMAGRARLIAPYNRAADCARVTAPSLIIQGDESLDHVTGSGGTAEYARLIGGARLVLMPHTGHLGSVTQPSRCADLIRRFLIDTTKDTHHSAA